MTPIQANQLLDIMKRADGHRKTTYRIYERFKRAIRKLGLTPAEYEQAIKRLTGVLKV